MKQGSEDRNDGPELIIGLVGAVGTDLALVSNILIESLRNVSYTGKEPIRLSKLLQSIEGSDYLAKLDKQDRRIKEHMDKGNDFRRITNRNDALALLSIGAINEQRNTVTHNEDDIATRCAYILWSLKTPEEVLTLRKIYKSAFLLISAYSPRAKRIHNLAKIIAESHHSTYTDQYRENTEHFIERDLSDSEKTYGQNVSDTFPLADVFVDASHPERLKKEIDRFVETLFKDPYQTPTRDEYGMFHAQAAAFRSAALSRQVGAVVTTESGDIISVGTNEVPKAGGGLYWTGDEHDHRDFTLGYDTSDKMKRVTLAEVLDRLKEKGWLSKDKSDQPVEALVQEALSGKQDDQAGNPDPMIKGTQLMNMIEFGRSVHAEMAALIDAARRGVGVDNCTLYSTTFPCHDCARHIVAAGIKRVVYIEPYPKSLAPQLYLDSIAVDSSDEAIDQVNFVPFVGIAPRKYMVLFEMVRRKDDYGNTIQFDRTKAVPRFEESPLAYLAEEKAGFKTILAVMENEGLYKKEV